MFCWPIYYDKNLTDLSMIENIHKAKLDNRKLDNLINEKIISFSDYYSRYHNVVTCSGYLEIDEKFIMSEAARVCDY